MRSTFHQGPKPFRAALAPCQRFARSNIAFRRFPLLCQARFTRTRNPPVHLSPFAAALPGRNSAFRGFQNLREARSTKGPKPFRASALPSPFALALPSRNTAVSKPARSTFHQGPKTLGAALDLCQRFARSNIAFKRFPHLRQARFTRTRNHPVHLSPFAATLLARSKFCI